MDGEYNNYVTTKINMKHIWSLYMTYWGGDLMDRYISSIKSWWNESDTLEWARSVGLTWNGLPNPRAIHNRLCDLT